MGKKIFYNDDARTRILAGAEMLYEAVKVTYGPKGGNVVIGAGYGGPTVTHDGVTVAESIDIQDVDDDTLGSKQGAELIKQAAQNLNKAAGDGTTTVTILTYHILREANRLIAAGENPQQLRKELEAAKDQALELLAKLAEEITSDGDRVAQIATISAGDPEIGKLIADIIKQIGSDGVVTVETSQGLELESEIVKGFTIPRGFVSQYMITDQARQEAVYDNVDILITDKKLTNIMEILPFLEKFGKAGKKDLVIIADDIDGELLSTLIINKVKGIFNTVAIKAPEFGDRRINALQDLAVITGGKVISDSMGHKFDTLDLDVLGSARKVIVGKDETTIIDGKGAQEDVDARIAEIRSKHKLPEYDKEIADRRAGALAGQVAVIKVGGATEPEIEEKKFRVDDAVAATKAALAEGIVPGGGITLLNIAADLKRETAGAQILVKSLKQPFLVLMENSGINGQAEINRVISSDGKGIDVNHPDDAELIDPKAAGVIDPVRVTREAIMNSVSIAATAATMGALVVDVPEAK
jgi:chaperonin GroEL